MTLLNELNKAFGYDFVGYHVAKEQRLQKENDTHLGLNFVDFVKLVESKGFTPVYQETFETSGDNKDTFGVWTDSSKGLLLVAESYFDSMNKAVIYGQCKYESSRPIFEGGSSPIDTKSCSFDLDAREALFEKLASIEEQADILPVWKTKNKYLHLENRAERKTYFDHNELLEKKLNTEIRKMICEQ